MLSRGSSPDMAAGNTQSLKRKRVKTPKCELLCLELSTKLGFPGGISGKEPTCQCRRPGFDPWVRKIPCRRKWQPTPVFLPKESRGTEEPGRLQSIGLQRVRHDRINLACTHKYKTEPLSLSDKGGFHFLPCPPAPVSLPLD